MSDETQSENTLKAWQAAAADIQIDGRAFINGQRSDSLSGETRPTINPANGNEIAEVAYCGADDADQAVNIAREACGLPWRQPIAKWCWYAGLN
jgi:gamma-glutamyl-gamma-aminobutyraldehyde dehydrogenase/4-guanidinobutyraldehyde dehydrogenase/NAD-dependent aldehyde dehydrogenase